MQRHGVNPDKDSGIVNDANLWATETMGNARHPLERFQRVITVSLETMKIANGLPELGQVAGHYYQRPKNDRDNVFSS